MDKQELMRKIAVMQSNPFFTQEDINEFLLEHGLRYFPIWCEGYRATGDSSGAMYLGSNIGRTLKDACIYHAETNPDFAQYFNKDRMTFWGCQIFDNEQEARRTFG